MKIILSATMLCSMSCEGHSHTHHSHYQLTPVTIPQLTSQGAVGVSKPILHQHGLIPVQVPIQQVSAPVAMTTATNYAVSAPKKGKVVDQTAPTYFCKKEGYTLDGQFCVKSEVVGARYVCPVGYDLVGGECNRRIAFNQVCPTDYEMRDGTCAKVITASSVQTCPDGSYEVSSGVCEKQVAQALTATCPQGQFDGVNCIVQAFAEARAFCPEGFSFFDGTCVQEEVYDCLSHEGLAALSRDMVHGHTRQLSSCGGYGATVTARATCNQVATAAVVAPIQYQPTKTTVTMQKTCTRVTSTALVFACDQGVLQNNRCLINTPVPPTMTCAHQEVNGGCYKSMRVAALTQCPHSYQRECMGSRCECAALEAAAFIQSCPIGFSDAGEGCVRMTQANIVCPPGFTLQGEDCIRDLREPADCIFSVTYECDRATGACA